MTQLVASYYAYCLECVEPFEGEGEIQASCQTEGVLLLEIMVLTLAIRVTISVECAITLDVYDTEIHDFSKILKRFFRKYQRNVF